MSSDNSFSSSQQIAQQPKGKLLKVTGVATVRHASLLVARGVAAAASVTLSISRIAEAHRPTSRTRAASALPSATQHTRINGGGSSSGLMRSLEVSGPIDWGKIYPTNHNMDAYFTEEMAFNPIKPSMC